MVIKMLDEWASRYRGGLCKGIYNKQPFADYTYYKDFYSNEQLEIINNYVNNHRYRDLLIDRYIKGMKNKEMKVKYGVGIITLNKELKIIESDLMGLLYGR